MSEDLIRRLIERRANAWEHAKAIVDGAEAEGRATLTGEEETTYQRANADIDALDARIRELRSGIDREADINAALRQVEETEQTRSSATVSAEDKALAFFRGEGGARALDVKSERRMGSAEFRTLSKLTAGAGANTVKTSFYDRLMAHLIEVAGMMQAGPTVLQTATGEQIQVPKTTAHSTASLVAEAGTIGASDPTFGQVPLDAYKYAFLVQVSNELVNDTSVDLLGYLAMQSGRALGNALGAQLITGTGSAQPQGVAPVATVGVTGGTGVVGAFTADNLIDLYFSVISPYRNSSSCAWLMRDATLGAVRKLKDTTNQYLWQPSLQVGAPDTLLGKPIVTDPTVAAVALSARSVLFGDFSQYFVRLVDTIRFERSDDFAFNTDLVTFRAIIRGDGDLVDVTGAVKCFVGAGT